MGRRLLYITNGIAGAGGLERVLSVRTRLLAERYGDEIHILTLNEEGKEPFYDFWPGIHVHDVRMQGNPAARLKAWASGVRKAVRAVKQQAETLKALAIKTGDASLAIAAAGLETCLAAGAPSKATLTEPINAVLALAAPESLTRAG